MAEKTHGKNVPIHKLGQEDAVIRKAKWASMKEEFLELSITAQGVHWPTLAAKYGFTPETARNKASINKWYAEIEQRRKDREDILEAKLTERTSLALDELNRDFATNEAAIRKRHATMARGLQARAITRIKEIDLKDLTARDALFMLKLGIDEERFAMGMPQTYEAPLPTNGHEEFKPLVEQLGGHQKVQKIGLLLLNALKSSDLDIEMLQEAGLAPVDVVAKTVYKPVPPATHPTPPPVVVKPVTGPSKPPVSPTTKDKL